MTIDVRAYNQTAWDNEVKKKNQWTIPVSTEEVDRARKGDWKVVLTPTLPVPREWFGNLRGKKVLGLASGGGQQGPLFAAAGAEVTIFDNSEAQLKQDQMVAKRDGLIIQTVQGDMRDLSAFADESFDLIFHPCSNAFVPNILPVWKEAYRVLKKGGALLSGFTNPVVFTMDPTPTDSASVQMKFKIPYSDLDHADDPAIKKFIDAGEPLCFGHTLQDQIGGQIAAGFSLTGFYEDGWAESPEPVHRFLNCFIATKATK